MAMTNGGGGADPKRPRRRSSGGKRRPVSVVGVLGELLITAGVFVLLFLGWQVWLNDIIEGAAQDKQAQQLSQTWKAGAAPAPPKAVGPGTPVVGVAPGNAQKFGILYVPRFGQTWERPIAQGVGVADVLDKIGVGHYPGSAMPGAVGNFAIAAHRHAYGGGFENLHMLHVGDHVYIGTKDGWYEYTFRDIEYVKPNQVNVLQPVPMEPGVAPVDRILTMTTCNPFFSTAERMIAFATFDTWYPYAEGAPPEIATTVDQVG
ncbi:MAG: sortase [Actinomycetota bacterium]|nr:sortase [Actinomycetota bacterium]